MNKHRFTRLACLGALALLWLSACSKDEVSTGAIDTSRYQATPGGRALFLADASGATGEAAFALREGEASVLQLFLKQTQATDQASSYTISIDAPALEQYNAAHGTSYALLPEGAVTLPEGGKIALGAGEIGSAAFSLHLTPSKLPAATSTTAVYVLPLRITPEAGSPALQQDHFFYLIQDERVSGSAAKPSGVKIISIPEVNDTNPLNTLSFTLKKTGKPLIDMVVLFSSNINYDERTGRVYIHHNENVTAILANKDKYLKPLKDRGIKVLLSILGNHDRAGVANLSDASARLFAQEIKNTCDAYDLDGVMLDDEYSKYGEAYGKPGFVSRSTGAISRLYYEIKKAQPHRINLVYVLESSTSLYPVEGKKPGDYIDYAVHDYLGSYDLSSSFPGLPKERQGMYSQEFNRGKWASESSLNSMLQKGYKTHMIFAMDPYRSTFSRQLSAMQSIARIFFNDDLVYDGKRYPKDWK